MLPKIKKDEYYMAIAKSVALKGNCLSVALGCVIVRDDQIISTGYVGAPRKTQDCTELGFCIRRKKGIKSGTCYETCRSVHAEANAIINAARAGVSLLNGDMYLYAAKREEWDKWVPVKSYPCLMCKKMIINAGIKRFVGNNENEELNEYKIEDWVARWQEIEDISLDSERYEVNYNKPGQE